MFEKLAWLMSIVVKLVREVAGQFVVFFNVFGFGGVFFFFFFFYIRVNYKN